MTTGTYDSRTTSAKVIEVLATLRNIDLSSLNLLVLIRSSWIRIPFSRKQNIIFVVTQILLVLLLIRVISAITPGRSACGFRILCICSNCVYMVTVIDAMLEDRAVSELGLVATVYREKVRSRNFGVYISPQTNVCVDVGQSYQRRFFVICRRPNSCRLPFGSHP